MKAERVTVSLPGPTLAAVEQMRRRLRKTRSAVVTEALTEWLRNQDLPDADRRYAEGYLRKPEASDETVAAGVVAEWSRWG